MRIVVTEDDMGWNGHSGIIMSNREGDFWVLLDHTVAQGMEVKHLLKPHQIQPEPQQPVTNPASSKETFTADQVEQKIAEAIAQHEQLRCAEGDREKAESEQGRFVKIRDAALQAAKREIQAAEQHARAIAQANQELNEQLAVKENEVRSPTAGLGPSLRALQTKNQQLEQRIAELEKALEHSSVNN
ncbi:MAG: hypothetical protein ACHBN1_00390 [Heteroscytonema crispum UTEX LB 1556]